MTVFIVPIVEGHTEVDCIERILQRVWMQLGAPTPLQVLPPSRGHRDAMVNSSHTDLADKIEEAQAKLLRQLRQVPDGRGFLLLLLDADEECPATLAPQLLQRARASRRDADIACVLAKRELENWFKAAAASLAGVSGLPNNLSVPANPEEGSGDAWLTRQIRKQNPRRKYTKPGDAVELARRMDLQQCRDHSPSFDKLCRELEARVSPPPTQGPGEEPPPEEPPAPTDTGTV